MSFIAFRFRYLMYVNVKYECPYDKVDYFQLLPPSVNSQVPYLYPYSYPDPLLALDPVLDLVLHHQSTY